MLVSKLQLTNVPEGIADVAAFGKFAYLNKFSAECVSNPNGTGTGVEVVDISRPRQPRNVGFIPAETNSYVGEGIHVVRADTPSFKGDILIHNNETCNATQPAISGASLWDVTNPRNPRPLSPHFGDTDPAVPGQTYHTTHSAQLFVQRNVLPRGKDRVIATLQDNQDLQDAESSMSRTRVLPRSSRRWGSRTGLAPRARTRTARRSSTTTCSTSGSVGTTSCWSRTGTRARCC
jgi:hypothetical protein